MDTLSTTLRPLLQPITHNLPGPLQDFALSLLGPECRKTLLFDVDLTSTPCLSLAISKALGIGIILASSVVKVPQILKLYRSKSSAGVSFLSYFLETTAYLISLAYNVRSGFPFSTYGETVFILVQNVVISYLVLVYSGRNGVAFLWTFWLAALVPPLFVKQLLDMHILGYLQAGAGVLGVAAKVPQIVTIMSEGTTGQLSAFAVFNYLAGSLSRIFTTVQEVDDKLILYGFVSGFALNLVLALQMVVYWNASPATKAKGKKIAQPVQTSQQSPVGKSSGVTPKKGPTTRRRG